MIEDEEIEYTLNTLEEQPDEQIGTIEEQPEEQISTINEDIYTIGVESLNGQAGHLTLKNINGTDLVGEGDLSLATSSALQSEAEAREQADAALQTAVDGKQAQLTETQLAAVNSGVTDTTVEQVATNASNITSLQNTKQDNLTEAQLTAVNSGIDSSKVEQIATNATNITNLQNTKQDNLTQTQLNAVNSGIDATKVTQIATNTGNITSNTNRITTIEGKIPSTATSSNQLTDKSYVDNAIATNTANYISDNGQPFQSLADLEAYSGPLTNNDYAFVETVDSAGNDIYTRYKYNADQAQWAEEYTITSSYFTSDQWASINSGIAANDVAQIGTNKTDIAGLQTSKQDKLTTAQQAAVDSGIDATKVQQIATNATNITALQTGKQDKLTAGTNIQINGTTISATDTTYTAGTNIDITSNVVSTQTRGVEYIVGTQTAATNVWTGVSTDKGCSNGTLYVGKTIVYYLPQAGNSSAATLTLALPDGTATSAIALRRAGSSTVTTHYAAGNAIFMTYDGTYWKTSAYYDSNTNTVSQLRAQNAFKAVTAITADTLCCGTSAGYIQLGAGSSFDITYSLLWQTAATTAGTTSTTFYYAIEGRTVRNNKSGWTGTTNQMVWLVGTLSGNTFTVDTDVFTQTIPTTDNGKVYAPIGIAYSTYQIYFKSPEQFWWFKSGEFRPVAQSEVAPAGFWSDPATITSTGTNLTLNNQLPVAIKNVQIDGDTSQTTYSGKNLANYLNTVGATSNTTLTFVDEGFRSVTTSSGFGAKLVVTGLSPSTTYALSFNLEVTSGTANKVVRVFEGTAQSVIYATLNGATAGANSLTFTTGAGVTSVNIWFYNAIPGAGDTTWTNIQLEAGSATTFEPYVGGIPSPNPDYPQNINVVTGDQTVEVKGKNWLNPSAPVLQSSVATKTVINNGLRVVASGNGAYTWIAIPICKRSELAGKTIVLKGFFTASASNKGNVSLGYAAADLSSRQVLGGFSTSGDSKTYDITDDDPTRPYIYAVFYSNSGGTASDGDYVDYTNFQLELGSTATAYQPYQSQSYTIDLGAIELCKIGAYQDYIYKANGNWYKHAEVGKAVLNGTESWERWAAGSQVETLATRVLNYPSGIVNMSSTVVPIYKMVCSHFQLYRQDRLYATDDEGMATTDGNLYLRIAKSSLQSSDVSGLQTWLSTHNTTVYYVLDTTTDTQITDANLIAQLEALANSKLYRPQTNIISSGTPPNLDAILTIETFQNNWNGLSSYILEANS